MRRHRQNILSLVVFMALLYNVERLDIGGENTINISSFVYALSLVMVLVTFSFRKWAALGPLETVSFWVGAYLLGHRLLVHRPFTGGVHTYLTISEMALLAGLALLVHHLGRGVAEFEDAVCTLTLGGTDRNVRSVEAASDEVRRVLLFSRRNERPLSVLLIEPVPDPESAVPHRAVEEMHRTMFVRFMVNMMANVVSDSIRRTDIAMQKAEDGQLVVVCPETDEDTAITVMEHIQAAFEMHLGFKARFGLASFPSKALTFEELIASAKAQVRSGEDRVAVQRGSPKVEAVEPEMRIS